MGARLIRRTYDSCDKAVQLLLRLLTASQIDSKATPDPVEQQSDASGGLKIFVHGDPDFEFELNSFCQNRYKLRHSRRDVALAATDPNPSPQRCKLGRVTVASKAEAVAG